MDFTNLDTIPLKKNTIKFLSMVTSDDIERIMSYSWHGTTCTQEEILRAKRAIPAVGSGFMTAAGVEMKEILFDFLARLDLSTLQEIVKRSGEVSDGDCEDIRDDVFYYYTQLKTALRR